MSVFTPGAGAARERQAGASREQRCSDRFGAQSIFAALLTLK